MSKADISYYDWELAFKKREGEKKSSHSNNRYLTSTGIPESQFREHLEKWKKENLK
ncbi:MAG: hypothetical protein GF317_19470 [Candidatus Lokiarchaeota archaeon]|nr:hypothetical protein [Candidatus Lokiarchaeota archaeon]MBD3201676.1 hypothetical protein [Candidatus Lokiarchaeota archaeon]